MMPIEASGPPVAPACLRSLGWWDLGGVLDHLFLDFLITSKDGAEGELGRKHTAFARTVLVGRIVETILFSQHDLLLFARDVLVTCWHFAAP